MKSLYYDLCKVLFLVQGQHGDVFKNFIKKKAPSSIPKFSQMGFKDPFPLK